MTNLARRALYILYPQGWRLARDGLRAKATVTNTSRARQSCGEEGDARSAPGTTRLRTHRHPGPWPEPTLWVWPPKRSEAAPEGGQHASPGGDEHPRCHARAAGSSIPGEPPCLHGFIAGPAALGDCPFSRGAIPPTFQQTGPVAACGGFFSR